MDRITKPTGRITINPAVAYDPTRALITVMLVVEIPDENEPIPIAYYPMSLN